MIQVGTSRALSTRRAFKRGAKMAVDDDPNRRPILQARKAHIQQRIVGQNRSDPDHDRIAMRPHEVDPPVRDFPGDHQARAMPIPRKAFGGPGELDGHFRPAGRDPHDVAAMQPPRLSAQDTRP